MLPIKDDQPRYSTPFVNWFLIALNILVFLFELQLSKAGLKNLFNQFALVPSHIWNPHYNLVETILPFFTAMFLHEGWQHVLGNMWFLFIFGDNVEDHLGHFKYLVFYGEHGKFVNLVIGKLLKLKPKRQSAVIE